MNDLEVVDQTGIDAAIERAALDAPLSPGWAAINRTNVREMVDEIFASSNPLVSWLRCIERLMRAVQPATSSRAT